MSKILLIIVALTCISINSNAKNPIIETKASDTRIEYTGRTLKTNEGVSFDWSGVYARIRFEGKSLSLKCSDTKGNWFNVWIDKEMQNQEDKKFFVCSKDTLINIVDKLSKGPHEVIIQKRTEGEQGTFTLHNIITEKPLLQAKGRKSRHIEFIGDSYTCGYGTESANRDCPFEAATENCNLTYAAIVSRYFNADYNLISHSGKGIYRNYDAHTTGENMPERYVQTFDMHKDIKWNPEEAPYKPDLVVIYLGTNDFSTGMQPNKSLFCEKYIKLMEQIRKNYGKDIPVVCMASKAADELYDYVKTAAYMNGLDNVAYLGYTPMVHNNEDELGASWHPNYKGHRKIATSLVPYISTITGWELEDKIIK